MRAFIAILVLLFCSHAAAETIDYSFSGLLAGFRVPPGTIATATGSLTFSDTGANIQASGFLPTITGAPDLGPLNDVGPIDVDSFDIAPDGDIISGLLQTGTGDEGAIGFELNITPTGATGFFEYYFDGYFPRFFVGDLTLTDATSVPEPAGIAVFAIGLIGLALTRRGMKPVEQQ